MNFDPNILLIVCAVTTIASVLTVIFNMRSRAHISVIHDGVAFQLAEAKTAMSAVNRTKGEADNMLRQFEDRRTKAIESLESRLNLAKSQVDYALVNFHDDLKADVNRWDDINKGLHQEVESAKQHLADATAARRAMEDEIDLERQDRTTAVEYIREALDRIEARDPQSRTSSTGTVQQAQPLVLCEEAFIGGAAPSPEISESTARADGDSSSVGAVFPMGGYRTLQQGEFVAINELLSKGGLSSYGAVIRACRVAAGITLSQMVKEIGQLESSAQASETEMRRGRPSRDLRHQLVAYFRNHGIFITEELLESLVAADDREREREGLNK